MKLICDVPDDIYNEALNGRYKCKECFDVITNGTPIPDNATNGDVIKAMFPNGIKNDRSTAYVKRVTEDWWNAPYQKGE